MLLFFAAGLFLAYSNGANDNFKGVATLYGSKILSYRQSLVWATITTFAGSLISISIGYKLLNLFSGSGTISPGVLQNPHFLISVAMGAAATVFLATIFGFPISTTHGLVGGLIGTGLMSGGLISSSMILKSFIVPLLASPFIAAGLTVTLYSVFHALRAKFGIQSNFCFCIGERREALAGAPGFYSIRSSGLRIAVEEEAHCRSAYSGTLAGINAETLMNALHVMSAGALCFARAVNDSPKIAALLLLIPFLHAPSALVIVGIGMLAGGLFHTRRIARRMSFDITEMNGGQAFTGNIVSAMLVIAGSAFGLPLSTTHVSCGALFGIGAATGKARTATIMQIFLAWLLTLPIAGIVAALFWLLLKK